MSNEEIWLYTEKGRKEVREILSRAKAGSFKDAKMLIGLPLEEEPPTAEDELLAKEIAIHNGYALAAHGFKERE